MLHNLRILFFNLFSNSFHRTQDNREGIPCQGHRILQVFQKEEVYRIR